MSAIQDAIDALLPDNTIGSISPEDLRDAFEQITTVDESAMVKAASTLTGFDREDMDTGGKQNGIIQFCMSASSEEVYQIGSDDEGTYTLLTSQTTFADGTALADRTMMVYHDSGETQFSYWRAGELIEVTAAKFIQVAAGFDGYIGFNSSGELDDTITDVRELIVRTPLVAYIYLNNTESTLIWFADERHGIVMSGQTHLQQHQSIGFFISGGLGVTGLVNNGTTFTEVASGGAGDEDIKMFFSAISTVPKMYKEGASGEWVVSDDDANLGIFRDSKCCYNLDTAGTWSLEEINLDYVIMMFVATNNKIHPIVMLVGQTLYDTRADARVSSPAEFQRINAAGLPAQELHPVAAMIIHSEANGQIEIGADGEIYFRCTNGFPVAMIN